MSQRSSFYGHGTNEPPVPYLGGLVFRTPIFNSCGELRGYALRCLAKRYKITGSGKIIRPAPKRIIRPYSFWPFTHVPNRTQSGGQVL